MTATRNSVILLAVLMAASALSSARKEETLQQLLARAQAAPLQEQPELYTEAAERQLAAADQCYTAGKVDDGRAAVQDVVTYSDKAGDAANKTGKQIKHTEIALRKMAAKLRDIKRSLAFEDQSPLQEASDNLEGLRTTLLSRMFGKEKK
jgi:hypothetical protein